MIATSRLYSERHPDVEFVWDKRSLEDFEALPIDRMAAKYDLMVIDHPHVGSVANSGHLLALDEIGRDDELAELADDSVGPSFPSYRFDRHQWALPIDTAAPVSAYRPDRIEEPCTDWDQVIALSETVSVVLPLKAVHALMVFFGLAVNCGFAPANSPDYLLDKAEAADVLAALSAVAKNLPETCFSMNPIDAYEAMSQSAGPVYCPHGYGYVSYALDGFRANRLRFSDFPAMGSGGVGGSVLGGTGIAVSAGSANTEIATDYAFWISGAACQKGPFFEAGGQPAHAAAWRDDKLNAKTGGFFAATRRSLDNAWLRPRYDGYIGFQEEGGRIVNAFLRGDCGLDVAIDKLNQAYRGSLDNEE
jgi:multiple sugar transport system substrate-binding protein